MFGRWFKRIGSDGESDEARPLLKAVKQQLPDVDQETVTVVSAVSGLLGAVAYADRDFSDDEVQQVRQELRRIHGMTSQGCEAIVSVLRKHIVEISTVQAPRYCRDLMELADRELRVEILQVLVDLAASDGEISLVEVNLLRQTTTALGLTQDDYNAAQRHHRDKLNSLR